MLPLCLPLTPPNEPFDTYYGPQSTILRSRSLNLRPIAAGMFNARFMGLEFQISLHFVHVVRHNGKCYLHNGFHRAYGLRKAGATHVPCLVRDVGSHAEVGINPNGANTFSAQLLESNDPPTLLHFTQGRAYPVQIRAMLRVLHVSWADYVIPNE